jgi:hypothetical protein
MANRGDMSPEDFERLLQWLGPDRDLSTKNYVKLHARLSRWFYFQGCRWPEDLTDEVWNRIAKKLPAFVTPDKDPIPVADIQPPDLVTKVAILQKRAEQERVTLPADVALFIATNIRSNVHELEGALMRLIAYSSLAGAEITLPYTQQVLKNFIDSQARKVTSESIQKDPVPILLGYARNVLREYRTEIIRFDEERDPNEEVARVNDTGVEVRALCLELCLQKLDGDERQLLREYHRYEPGRKIEHRQAMANARQSTLNAIRLKVSRLMSNLRKCVKGCCRSRGLEVQ